MTNESPLSANIAVTSLEEEMRTSYLDYAMSVIVGRALPDVRDGLKPVHRRVLYAMNELGNSYNSAYKKSARIVGDVIGKYHPHGDTAVYDAIVRMAQDFSMRHTLIDGQGNFGSVDGDAAAAMRYTEIRMQRITHEMLADIDKDTVDFISNYDESEEEPAVLPARIPNLLVNGSSGIAVGMATNIPAHNLKEVIDAVLALSHHPDISIDALMEYLPGPDFPTAASINGVRGIREAYHTGKGRIYVRSRSHFENIEDNSRQAIVITELPYAVNKARLIERIAELVRGKKILSIAALRDESDKQGMRVVIELKRDEAPETVLNQLFKMTALQSVFGINMVALVDGQPQLLNLKQILEAFLSHRATVVTRRSLHDLERSRARAHVLEGLSVALANIDEMITMIRRSTTPSEARRALLDQRWDAGVVLAMIGPDALEQGRPQDLPPSVGVSEGDRYRLSDAQARAIVELRLYRLTGLEQEKIHKEYRQLQDEIVELLHILRDSEKLMAVIRAELTHVRDIFSEPRRTIIQQDFQSLSLEDTIPQEKRVVTLSHRGYVKTQPLAEYREQRRGGKGRIAAGTKQEDVVVNMFIAHSHDMLLCFSSHGKVYWKKVYEMPSASRRARGKPIVNLLPLEADETITAVLPVQGYRSDRYIVMVTERGIVKKTSLMDYSRPRVNGIIALNLKLDDRMMGAMLTDGSQHIMLFSSGGKAIRFCETYIRATGRATMGVIGIRIDEGDKVIAMITSRSGEQVLTATGNGYGKCTEVDEYPVQGRGGRGVISIKTGKRNGPVVGALIARRDEQVMLISDGGTMMRIPVDQVAVTSRNTMGVRLIRLNEGEALTGLARVSREDEEDSEENENIPG